MASKDLVVVEEKKNKGGRPPVILTDEQKKKVRDLASICTTQQIADYLSVSRPVFFDILNRDEEVSLLYKKGRAEGHNFVAGKLMERIQNNDTTATIFYLKTQSRWKEAKDEEEIQDKELKITIEVKENENTGNLKKFEKLKSKIFKK